MARTKADVIARKAISSKAPRKTHNPPAVKNRPRSSLSSGRNDKSARGNPYCPRPTPSWQKTIGSFYKKVPKENTGKTEHQVIETSPVEDVNNGCQNEELQPIPSTSKGQCENNGSNDVSLPGPSGLHLETNGGDIEPVPGCSHFETNGSMGSDEDEDTV